MSKTKEGVADAVEVDGAARVDHVRLVLTLPYRLNGKLRLAGFELLTGSLANGMTAAAINKALRAGGARLEAEA